MHRHLLWLAAFFLAGVTYAAEPDRVRIERLIKQLGSEKFSEREAASKALEEAGEDALPALRNAKDNRDPEVRRRAVALAKAIIRRLRAQAEIAPKPLMSLYGRNSKITKEKLLRVTSTKEWKSLWLEHKTGRPDPKELPRDLEHVELDFEEVMVLAIFEGESSNCQGFTAHSIREDGEQIIVRVKAHNYQSGVITPATQAWGILVLPRSDKEVVLELDVRALIDAPPEWKRWTTFPKRKTDKK
jgi:hypothetical protein